MRYVIILFLHAHSIIFFIITFDSECCSLFHFFAGLNIGVITTGQRIIFAYLSESHQGAKLYLAGKNKRSSNADTVRVKSDLPATQSSPARNYINACNHGNNKCQNKRATHPMIHFSYLAMNFAL